MEQPASVSRASNTRIPSLRIGVDFDNTLVCYETLFHRVALERGLIPAGLPETKNAVRAHLQHLGRNDLWTELQGLVYGERIEEADPFPGALAFFHACRNRGIPLIIVSHKSLHPALGPQFNLHEAARRWLRRHGFFTPAPTGIGMTPADALFNPTRAEKIAAIAAAACTDFIDDLPEVFTEPSFPSGVRRHLFDPADFHASWKDGLRATSWAELTARILPS